MRNIFLTLLLCGIVVMLSSFISYTTAASSSSYDIVEIYKEVRVDSDAKVIDSRGDLQEVKKLLVPARLDRGKRTIRVTRVGSNLYQICDTDYYIQTRYCYEYATREEVVVNITSAYGYTKGEIIFF